MMRSHARVLILFAALICAATAQAQSYTYSVYIDSDNSSATGCSVSSPGGTLAGIESALTIAVAAGATPTVTSVTRSSCSGASLGAPVTEGTGAVSVGSGVGGTTSIELSDALVNLAGPSPTAMRLYVVAQSASGSDVLLNATGAAGGAPIISALQAPGSTAPAPLLGIPALFLLCAALLALGSRAVRRRMIKRLMLGFVLLSGTAGAAALFNWNGIAPLATDPAGDSTSDESAIDLRYFLVAASAPNLYFRIDVTGSLAALPTVTAVSPTAGPTVGGTSVTITGTNFTGATAVKFGATAATTFTVDDATTITAMAPAGSSSVDVTVTTPGGTSATSAVDQYTYVAAPTVTMVSPASGPAAGGTAVTITGTNFGGATAVTFGATPASFTENNATTITATAPAGSGGTVDVTVTTVGSTSATSSADRYTYTFTLTTGVDTVVGGPGDNIIDAILDNSAGVSAGGPAATLQSSDTITGGASNNTLNIADYGLGSQMTIPTGASITGMTTVNVSSLEGIGASYSTPLDFTTLGTLSNVNINASSGNDYVKVGSTTALVLTDTNDDDIYTWGGSTVTVNNNPAAGSYGNYVEVRGGANTTSVTVNNGYDEENYIYDPNQGTSGTNTISSVTINNQVDYDTYIYSNALTQLNLTDITYHYVYDYGTTGTRALNVALNGDGTASGYSGDYWYLETNAATLNVSTTGVATVNAYFYAPNATAITFDDAVDMSFYNGTVAGSDYFEASSALSVTISGAGAFTADLSGLNSAAVIDASASTGKVTIEMASAQSFTGGTGGSTVTVGDHSNGTINFGSHATGDAVTLGVSGTSLTAIETISGLNSAGNDTLTFSGDANALTIIQVTEVSVVNTGGDPNSLSDWVAAADGLNGVVAGAAHTVAWFQFQGNTYLLESVAGQTADSGTMAAGNTLVKLVGAYSLTSATSTAGGVVHL